MDALDLAQRRIDAKRRSLAAAPDSAKPLRDAAGLPALPAPLAYCEKCGDGLYWEPESGRCSECEEAAPAAPPPRESILGACQVPARYRQTFHEPTPWPTPSGHGLPGDLATWTGDPWSVAMMGGAYGAGKSMIAAELLCRAVAARSRGGRWVRADELIAAMYGRLGPERQQQAHGLAAVDALVIDELGRAHVAPSAWETISGLIGVRYDWKRPTIITTNLRREELMAVEGSLWDRLRDGLIVPVLGESRRGRSAD